MNYTEKECEQEPFFSKVTRVEVIDEKGRSYVNWDKNNLVRIDLQDDQRTLKIFISKRHDDTKKPTESLRRTGPF